MDESHNVGKSKEARHKIMYTVFFHLYKVCKHTKLLSCVRTKYNSLPSMRRERPVIRREREDGFQDARKFYFLTWVVGTAQRYVYFVTMH